MLFIPAMKANAAATQAALSAQQASSDASATRTKTTMLQADIERLFMITEALWTILKQERGYSDEDLIQKIKDIDLKDGKLNGKVDRQPNAACPQCGRTLLGTHSVCLYCGTAVMRDPFER